MVPTDQDSLSSRLRWNVETDLISMAGGTGDLLTSLERLDIIDAKDARTSTDSVSLPEVRQASEWARGGETFSCLYSTSYGRHVIGNFFVKAFISSADKPGAIAEKWVARRNRLEKHGVCVPKLYGVASGMLYEQYIPFDLRKTVRESRGQERLQLLSSVGATLARVAMAGFSPLPQLAADWRSTGQSAIICDFGSDLGGFDDYSARCVSPTLDNIALTPLLTEFDLNTTLEHQAIRAGYSDTITSQSMDFNLKLSHNGSYE